MMSTSMGMTAKITKRNVEVITQAVGLKRLELPAKVLAVNLRLNTALPIIAKVYT